MSGNKKDQGKHKSRRRGKGEGTVYPRKDGRWAAEIILENGKRKWIYGKTQEEAIAKRDQAKYELKQGVLATGPKQKLADHLKWWLEEVHKQKIRESSYNRYRIALEKHILPALGQIQLQKLTTQKIQAFYNEKAKEGQSASSLHTMQKVLHKALDYAVKIHLISYNPSEHIALPRQTKRKVKPLTLEQARHLLRVAKDSPLEMFLTLALATGMRHGELLALRWEDIDFEKGSIYVHRTVHYLGKGHAWEGPPKTAAGERTILVSKTICDILRVQKVRQKERRLQAGPAWQDHDLVFCNNQGNFLLKVTVSAQFYKLLEKAGLPRMRIHDLRHTASTLLQEMGVNPKVVQEMLGHSHVDMTFNVYSHVLPSMQAEAVEKIDRMFQ